MADEQTQALTVELDEKGAPKELPEPLQRELDRRVNAAVQTALKNAEKKGGLTPAEREELTSLREKASLLEQTAAEHNKNWEEALRIQAERLERKREADLAAEREHVKARDKKIETYQQATKLAAIRAAAVAAGARDESLEELTKLLGADVTFDPETDTPIAKGADGTPQPVADYVTAYLQAHQHHLGRAKGAPGRSTGGASLSGKALNPAAIQREALLERSAQGDTKAQNAYIASAILKRG